MLDRAFIFDVFGTFMDWRSSVARDVAAAFPGVPESDWDIVASDFVGLAAKS